MKRIGLRLLFAGLGIGMACIVGWLAGFIVAVDSLGGLIHILLLVAMAAFAAAFVGLVLLVIGLIQK